MVKNPPADAGDTGLTPGSGRSLEKEMAITPVFLPTPVFLSGKSHGQRNWWATVHGVAKELDVIWQLNNNTT